MTRKWNPTGIKTQCRTTTEKGKREYHRQYNKKFRKDRKRPYKPRKRRHGR